MSHATPVVTAIMPTRNRAHLVGRAIRSVLAQTFEAWELLVVDDGSQDETAEVVAGFPDPRIRFLRNTGEHGPAQARNAGIRAAGGSAYLAFLDDDDEWLPPKLERQLAVFEAGPPDLGAVGCGRIDRDVEGVEIVLPSHRGWIFEDLLARRARGYSGPLLLVRRSRAGPDVLFDESLPCLEDAEYVLRIARDHALDYVPEALVNVYRDDGGPHAWNSARAMQGYSRMTEKYAAEMAQRPAVLGYYHFCVAKELAGLRRPQEFRERMRLALAQSPGHLRMRTWYAASYLGSLPLRACRRLLPVQPPI